MSSKSGKRLPRYGDLTVFFQNGGRPPSWTCWARIRTILDDNLVVSILVQNLVEIDAVVLIVWNFRYFGNACLRPKIVFFGGDFTPKMGSNINGTPKGHTLARDRVVWAIKRENLSTSLICRRVPEKGVKIVIFHPFAQKPPWADLHQIWHSRRGRRLNDLYQFFGDRLRGVDSVGGGRKLPSPIDKASRR